MRFEVVGVMDKKIQLSNYFTSDDNSTWIPFSTASDLYDNKNTPVFIFAPLKPSMEALAKKQFLASLAERQGFSPTDDKAVTMFGREEFRPIIDGITIGMQGLLLFIGALTLGIGGVGVMNIMLVSVDERIREIGLRRALGARKRHIQLQLFAETFTLMFLGGAAGILLSWALTISSEPCPCSARFSRTSPARLTSTCRSPPRPSCSPSPSCLPSAWSAAWSPHSKLRASIPSRPCATQ